MTRFSESLDSSSILVDWQPSDKWKAIRELIDVLEASGAIVPAQAKAVADAVNERERKMSTGLEAGIAIPHANTNAIAGMTAALGIASDGFDFEALDGEPTQIVVLLVYPNSQLQAHVRMLASIARLLGQQAIREALLQAETPTEALEILSKGEQAVGD